MENSELVIELFETLERQVTSQIAGSQAQFCNEINSNFKEVLHAAILNVRNIERFIKADMRR